ncbi:SIS domain-containing protein [Simplicispira hankyongi]|jgi:D-sedoheptulose 7-phosphate isomerase|uniref:SIS domain-containing protein n=1 Tax=Simplicispira hankyongi TaxID=2315688 RepID=A0A398C7Z7_9BURK|nr:SIS domain-containing protein [Simplicispira hankyongi]RID97367.1 SIS domain-containing protein [Simplicispira hankyongi]
MLEQRIQQHFIDSADLKYQAAQLLCKPVSDAVQALLVCVTSGGKILVCGNGASAGDGQQFVASCVAGFERNRPELAALALSVDGSLLTGSADPSQQFARQVRALGQAGDVLLLLCIAGNDANLLAAVSAAHEREMIVIALTGRISGALGGLLRETDIGIGVPHERAARVREVHALVLNCLCDGIDEQLFGEQEIS